ncbi:unnamed protein product [Phaedon cochleariae]|uniref:Protein ELYS n=1 Tax=Phaedon cochleariae TaxID=80249 RepID=A0A9N9SKA7_PHACE|nr:unnamed protein product [Phaedon cochleariae]
MSLSINKVQQFRQPPLQYIRQNENQPNHAAGTQLLGGIFQDSRHVWHAKGASLEVRDTRTGCKVGAWMFGSILKDSNTKIVCVEEISRPYGRLSLLAVGLDCTISGGIICFFDVFSSKVVRAIQINEKISALHIIDPGIEDLNLPGPLRNFDGILSIGTKGGHVFLIDICRQICEESLHSPIKHDELNPCQLVLLTSKNITRIEQYKEKSVRDSNHLAIHLNAVLDSQTEHFTLKGPEGDDRIHVNREEVLTSGLYYCPQLTSLLVGYNFGAFQLWNLTTLQLAYTSPVCDEHLPVGRFALQEPADDPRAFCYIWVSYGNTELYQSGLPLAAMYSVCYESKEYHEGYGYLYQDFRYCVVRFQVELGPMDEHRHSGAPKGGFCLDLQPITKLPPSKDPNCPATSGDTLALCLITWSVWHSRSETHTCALLFDLNQWYKEQMPSVANWKDCANYMLRLSPGELTSAGSKPGPVLALSVDQQTLRQFMGVQRLEEHFHPTALSFDLWMLKENEVISVHNEGVQHLLLSQIEATGPLCLLKPSNIARQVVTIGLQPLFVEDFSSSCLDAQREVILNVGLEHQLVSWLCKCASEWANGSFASAGCSLEALLSWAFQRAVTLKSNCDRYCAPLFDYSQVQLDGNTANLLNCCIRQINNLCTLYSYVLTKLGNFLVYPEAVGEQHRSLQMVSVYFEVLQWLVNIGLLPECPPSTYPRQDNSDRISAPYPVRDLVKFYDEKRAQLRSSETFFDDESLLFIDNLVERKCGGPKLQKQWQEDGGTGLYPPPSLQSLIRAYLIEGAGISHKHSLVIYLFLDLAMALDQNEYSAVITYLIKFPAVFKVSTSSIKITQAFWQLDHGDFTTALEHLLDPFVLGEDLQDWHHSVIMRSLCVQKQYNFALLYLQTLRPPMTREKDVMTAISLFVANKMLDEAFYFMKQHHNNNAERLLAHLFNECRKNDTLHDLLYKNLSSAEEKSFIGFLKGSANPASDELQVFYYLLRSRFLEAFDFHAGMGRGKPDRQGLIGQSNVSRADQVVRIFKSLLPDVSRKLVDYVRKEKGNLWREVQKPTPLSVFVHNTEEQIRYKSTLIRAALTKAKQTDGYDISKRYSEVITEDTPFLRTPKACKSITRLATPVITPKVIELGEEDGPSPAKKLKLSPRTPTYSPHSKLNTSVHSMMLTPIVKRKTSVQKADLFEMHTPQSILKGKNLARYTAESSVNEVTIGEDHDEIARSEFSPKKTGLQPRRSLSRTPRPHVQFDIATRASSSFSDQSSRMMETTSLEDQILQGSSVEDQILQRSSLSSRDISAMVSTKDNTNSTSEETFYSPDNSVSEEVPQEKEEEMAQVVEDKRDLELKGDEVNGEPVIQSPRARRSYKRSYKEMSPVRSSPRLSKQQDQVSLNKSSSTEPSQSEIPSISDESVQSPRLLHKVKGRKSLSRQVLEHNAFSKIQTPVRASSEISITKTEKTVLVEKTPSTSKITTVESTLDISDVTNLSNPQSPISQKSHNVTSNISRKSILESDVSFDSDTTIGSDIFPQEQPKRDIPEIPEWLNEYVASLQARKNKIEQPPPNEEDIESPVDIEEPPVDIEEPPVDIEESPVEIKKQLEQELDPTEAPPREEGRVIEVEGNEQKLDNDAERPIDKEKSREVISMEIYDDLSCGSEASYPEEKKEDHSHFDELELNVFQLATPNQTQNIDSESSFFNVPDADVALIVDSPDKEDQAIVILSSEEDTHSYQSSYEEDINVSFERNIQEEDCSTDQSTDNDERHEDIEHPENGIREDLACSSSSTEKWGSEDREAIAENQEADWSVGEDQRVIFEQNEPADGEENDSSSSSTTEKWNFSDQEVNENSNAESLTEEEPVREVEPQTGITTEVEELQQDFEMEDAAVPVATEHEPSEVGEPKQTKEVEENDTGETNEEAKSAAPEDQISVVEEATHVPGEDDEESKNPNEEIAASLLASKDQTMEVEQAEGVDDNETHSDIKEFNETNEEAQSTVSLIENSDNNVEVMEIEKTADENVEAEGIETQLKPMSVILHNNLREHSIGKEELSTNTTLASDDSKLDRDGNRKRNQSTNTTINETDSSGPKPDRRDLKSSKDSSSDTTVEGDSAAHQILVTAQVHTEPPIRRVTRRSSLLMTQGEGDTTPSIFDDTLVEPGSMDVSSSDDLIGADPRTPTRMSTRTRRSSHGSGVIDCQSSTSKETVVEPKVAALLRKTRSSSVDDVKTYSRKRSLQRSNSVDEKPPATNPVKTPKGKGRARSVVHMPAISEEGNGGDRGNKATYATSRRLTRSQASMVRDVEEGIDLGDGEESDKTIKLDYIDPIVLLDKESYQGEQDPEEKKIYEGSSPSNSTVSSFTRPARRKSRSVSVASDISLPLSPTKSVTPEKITTRKYGSGVNRRVRKQSETSSVVSEKAEPATPSKRTRKKAEVTDVEVPKPRTTRSRGNSVSSAKSDSSNSPRKSSRSRRVISAKSDLPEITEEKSIDFNQVSCVFLGKCSTQSEKTNTEAKVTLNNF